MSYTFRVYFSGLCLHHVPRIRRSGAEKEPSGAAQRANGFGAAVLLVNALEPKTSIDRKTHLHRHVPTLTFDPADLDDYTLDVGTFETDFRLIPTGAEDQSGTAFQGNLALLDLQNKVVSFELHEEDRQPFRVQGARERYPQRPTNDEEKNDFCWVPSLAQVDRRIRGLKRQCFASILNNPLVASRVILNQGILQSRGVEKREAGATPSIVQWDFYPNAYPGRRNPYEGEDGGAVEGNGTYKAVQQALADQVVLEFSELKHPIKVHYEGDRTGTLVFPRSSDRDEDDFLTLHIANLPSLPDLPDTDVVTHFRWFYELVEWKNGLPSDLPAPRPASRGLALAAGGGGSCPTAGYP